MRKFHFVDFAAHYQKGFRNHVVSVKEVPALVQSFRGFGCYATYFFYSDEVLTYMSARAENSTPTIAGYDGRVWAPYFPIDLDHPDLALALEAARSLTSLFVERWGVDMNAIQIYFSGSKGFHLMLDSRIFGKISPARSLPLLFDSLRRHVAQELPERLHRTVDLSIRDRVRLLRLPNTRHEKSGLHKIILPVTGIETLTPEEIRDMATDLRPLAATDETGLLSRVAVEENDYAGRLIRRIRRQLRRITRKPFAYRFHRPPDLERFTFPCAGAQGIWESHVEAGQRNNCAIRLASELRLLGLTEDEARDKMFAWNANNVIGLSSHEITNVVRSAYQHRFPYRYSCRDEMLRGFCPLPDYEACRARLAQHSAAG